MATILPASAPTAPVVVGAVVPMTVVGGMTAVVAAAVVGCELVVGRELVVCLDAGRVPDVGEALREGEISVAAVFVAIERWSLWWTTR